MVCSPVRTAVAASAGQAQRRPARREAAL